MTKTTLLILSLFLATTMFAQSSKPVAGKESYHSKTGMTLINIRGGTFRMGQPDPNIGCEGFSDK
ncbi:MAG: hypothetical protein HC831_19230 [Chloroflexia bacterium]|nr:hypothetical protein [Chloroflexia bacterium]